MWSEEEDQYLLELVKRYGLDWATISRCMDGNRSGKQIRDHYLNKLAPAISKDKWTEDEDHRILALFKIHGRKWRKISELMPGRSEAMVKNRFYGRFKAVLMESEPLKDSPSSQKIDQSKIKN